MVGISNAALNSWGGVKIRTMLEEDFPTDPMVGGWDANAFDVHLVNSSLIFHSQMMEADGEEEFYE